MSPGVAIPRAAILEKFRAMIERGEPETAAALASEMQRTSAEVFPPGCVPRARVLVLLAESALAAGRPGPPPALLAEALATLETELASDHPLVERARAIRAAAPVK